MVWEIAETKKLWKKKKLCDGDGTQEEQKGNSFFLYTSLPVSRFFMEFEPTEKNVFRKGNGCRFGIGTTLEMKKYSF